MKIIACEIGKISFRPLEQRKQMCNRIRVHIYDAKCKSLEEAQVFLANLISSFKHGIKNDNMQWFTTKMVIDQKNNQSFKRINFIVMLPEPIDILALKSYTERVFEQFGA